MPSSSAVEHPAHNRMADSSILSWATLVRFVQLVRTPVLYSGNGSSSLHRIPFALVAQLAEHWFCKPAVGGSTPLLGSFAGVAQLVERVIGNDEVISPKLIISFRWRSSTVERLIRNQDAWRFKSSRQLFSCAYCPLVAPAGFCCA